jgi:uncharacterized protein YndB with AHSA1/START domain
MNEDTHFHTDPSLDLVLIRQTNVSPELVWKAWTTPDLLMQWFCPKPWKVSECKIDLRPGGRFWTVMESPEGEQFPGDACYLEVVENRRLVWTSALLPGYRPKLPVGAESGMDMFSFTAIIEFQPNGSGTTYTATVIHADEAARKRHEGMGFESGWGTAFDQLVELMSEGGTKSAGNSS